MIKKTNPNPVHKPEDHLPDNKSYAAPEITFETDLETKAGTPLGNPDSDLFLPGLDEPGQ